MITASLIECHKVWSDINLTCDNSNLIDATKLDYRCLIGPLKVWSSISLVIIIATWLDGTRFKWYPNSVSFVLHWISSRFISRSKLNSKYSFLNNSNSILYILNLLFFIQYLRNCSKDLFGGIFVCKKAVSYTLSASQIALNYYFFFHSLTSNQIALLKELDLFLYE